MPMLTEPEIDTEQGEDTEVTLTTGKMLGLFFALVALCAVFFSMGYKVGKSSSNLALKELPSVPADSSARPAAAKSAQSATPDLTFYKTVEQNNADPQLNNPQNNSGVNNSGGSNPANAASADGNAQPAASGAGASPASTQNEAAPAPPGSGYYVQVAAVSKQEDADALVEALKKKQYPAFSSNGQGDSFFHVQVGPYSDIKQAEDMRAKLVSDGYNPILKK